MNLKKLPEAVAAANRKKPKLAANSPDFPG
jgi:hypothetical protein